jgi:hypothetical protein
VESRCAAILSRRFGDRLCIVDSHKNKSDLVSSAVLIVTDLDGTVLWNKRIGDGIAKLCGLHVAVDEQQNVYSRLVARARAPRQVCSGYAQER